MGYNPTTQIISQPVSIYDVQRALGVGSPDLATLCMRDNVNMWSPRKPIYSPKVVQLTNADWQGGAHTDPDYKNGGGIKKRLLTGQVYLNSVIANSGGNVPDEIWTHDKPILDGICAFRLTDFSGYWHTAVRMFTIGTIYGNIQNIIVPSTDADQGTTLGFSLWFTVNTGQITAHELFGDCWNFYPGVIMTCSSTDKLNYVVTANSPISAYVNSTANFTINTRLFMNMMMADWRTHHSGDPYANYPFRTGDRWTACIVLLGRRFDGGSGDFDGSYTLANSDNVVRLEYENPTNNVYVDRRTLPLKQSKYNNIEWMKMKVTIQRVGIQSGNEVYRISSIAVTAKLLTTSSITFTVDARALSTPQGIVNVSGVAQAQSVDVTGYISAITFSGSTGEVTKTFIGGTDFAETTYYVPSNATVGNKLCNGTLMFNNNGKFSGGFSIDISTQNPQYEQETNLL